MRNFIELEHRLIIKFSINKYLIKFYKILLLYELKYQSSVKNKHSNENISSI